MLRPRKISESLVKIGGKGDGVYMIPENLDGVVKCLSPGVGDTNGFELDLYDRYKICSDLIDFSVQGLPVPHHALSFEKKYLGMKSEGCYIGINDWVEIENPGTQDDLILQMDIEGAEYEVITGMSERVAERFRVIAMEFHDLELLCDRYGIKLLKATFEKLNLTHTPVYLKANNETPAYEFNGVVIPKNIEVTFMRKKRLPKRLPCWTYEDYISQSEELNSLNEKRVLLSEHWFSDKTTP